MYHISKMHIKQTKSVNNRKTGKTAMALTWYRHFQRNGGLNHILRRQTSRFHYGLKVPVVTITVFLTMVFPIPHLHDWRKMEVCLNNFNKGKDDEGCLKFCNILKWSATVQENY
jgi:hypothetical protein